MLGADGVARPRWRVGCERALMSLFGEVNLKRMGYGARGESGLSQPDAEPNLPADKYSHGLREGVAQEGGRCSFDAAVASVQCGMGA